MRVHVHFRRDIHLSLSRVTASNRLTSWMKVRSDIHISCDYFLTVAKLPSKVLNDELIAFRLKHISEVLTNDFGLNSSHNLAITWESEQLIWICNGMAWIVQTLIWICWMTGGARCNLYRGSRYQGSIIPRSYLFFFLIDKGVNCYTSKRMCRILKPHVVIPIKTGTRTWRFNFEIKMCGVALTHYRRVTEQIASRCLVQQSKVSANRMVA